MLHSQLHEQGIMVFPEGWHNTKLHDDNQPHSMSHELHCSSCTTHQAQAFTPQFQHTHEFCKQQVKCLCHHRNSKLHKVHKVSISSPQSRTTITYTPAEQPATFNTNQDIISSTPYFVVKPSREAHNCTNTFNHKVLQYTCKVYIANTKIHIYIIHIYIYTYTY